MQLYRLYSLFARFCARQHELRSTNTCILCKKHVT